MKINRFILLGIGAILSILCSYSFLNQIYYIPESEVSRSFGLLLAPILIGFINLLIHIIIFIYCFFRKKEINIQELFLKKEDHISLNIVRILGYSFIVYLIKDYMANYSIFYIWEFIFYGSTIILACVYIIWFSSFYNSRIYRKK